MSDEPVEPKILTFPKRPGRALTPVAPKVEESPEQPTIDPHLVTALENALEGAKTGLYSGFAILTMKKDGSFHRYVGLPPAPTFEEQQLKGFAMHGAMSLLDEDMKFLALQKYPSVADAIDEAEAEQDQ